MEYKFQLSVGDGLVELREGYDDLRSGYMRQILNTREALIREGLIKLGWTPPGEHCGTEHPCCTRRQKAT